MRQRDAWLHDLIVAVLIFAITLIAIQAAFYYWPRQPSGQPEILRPTIPLKLTNWRDV